MTNLFFIRHAHTVLNGKRLFQGGQTDSELDEVGKRQLADSASGMKNALPSSYLLVCSPLIRTKQTAEGLHLNTENEIFDKKIQEIGFGTWEGRSLESVKNEFPSEVARYYTNDPTMTPQGGESIQSVANRMVAAINYYAKSDYQNVVFVSHGNSISIGLSALLLESAPFKRIIAVPDNVSVSKLAFDDNISLKYYNHTFY
ncbi:histidine phosphatase family protein [Companilactobacillus huachuanensis]|uniref:Histidine phosphatase family protein n=1 Tax=Companilactobacillus huachuanensis TaxID=2559914 RepID=A0ABW1RQE6_9LACO|nr:histidine phosphatase family protein [Companilactobacillus huachuanensis]